jgi:hypothetical protein
VEFTTQPIDSETGTPIYSVCVPSGGAAPCALAGATGSTSIKVLAKDAFGNRAGAGSPGADLTTDDVNIQITRDGATGVLANVSTSDGVADFADLLSIVPIGSNNRLYAVATTGATGTPSALSDKFSIVNDLEACDNQACDNNANNGNARLQRSFGRITTTTDFFGGSTNVLLSTQFVPGTDTNQAACGNTGSNKTIGDAVDLLVTNAGGTAPRSTMVLVMPKATLKAFGITARGTDTFNVCLGAKNIGGATVGWKAKDPTNKKAPLKTTVSGPESRFWGTPANCGTAGLSADDPCIGLRTKQAAAARAYLGMTTTQFAQLGIKDADLVVIIEKRSPWDGKGGLY